MLFISFRVFLAPTIIKFCFNYYCTHILRRYIVGHFYKILSDGSFILSAAPKYRAGNLNILGKKRSANV
jgi:hypothetical protein